ncbi:hypothetical protein [Porphyrobacter sp. LM 6]|uniref:hypothetical protein n=1 Tax=Porphyrobacter sp. LM 6 TaxID=1896196 RepID=UPI0012378904|nr:hypothetical protein [Porphyrobacter sp. LM 6]
MLMSLRVQAVPALVAAAVLQPACATSSIPPACQVSGELSALPGMDTQAICDLFTQDLNAALGEDAATRNIAVALTLHQRGTIEAQLSARQNGRDVTYPSIAVDVSDRALQSDDITRLAKAAAQVLNDPAAATAAHDKDA